MPRGHGPWIDVLRANDFTFARVGATTTAQLVWILGPRLPEPRRSVRVLDNRHVEGIFPRATWLRLLAEVGSRVDAFVGPWELEVFVGVRRVGASWLGRAWSRRRSTPSE